MFDSKTPNGSHLWVVGLLLASLALLTAPVSARAQAAISVSELESIRVDGSLRDWRSVRFAGVSSGRDHSMSFAIGHGEDGLYLAARVFDDRMVRTARPGHQEDAIIVRLAAPDGGRRVQLNFYAGVSGRSAARLTVGEGRRSRPLAGAQIVEGPLVRGRGYAIEAFIPMAGLLGRVPWDRASAAVALVDVDSESQPVVETFNFGGPPGQEPNFLRLAARGGAGGALASFLSAQHLDSTVPRFDLNGDVAGDGRAERVFLVANFLLVTGPGYRGGNYAYQALPVRNAEDIRSAELRDLTGDGKAELIVRLRQRNAQGERELWQVMSLSGAAPTTLFAAELRKATSVGSVEGRVRIRPGRRGAAPTIVLSTHRARGLTQENYRERPAEGVQPILLPWGPLSERSFRWDGRTIVQVAERANRRYRPQSTEASASASNAGAARGQRRAPAARLPTTEALLTAFRQRARVGANARARFSFDQNLIGSRAAEHLRVYGRTLVVVGPGIQGGTSWLHFGVPVARDEDLLRVQVADVTGDRAAEVLIFVRQMAGDVERRILLVHQVREDGFPRLLQVEIARISGDNSVRNQVVTRRGRLEIRSGRAEGYGAQHWPFSAETSDAVQPLLLPWRDRRPARYRFSEGRLTR